MSYERNIKYLNERRIIYRTIPQDEPTTVYDWGLYYKQGTYQCYDLFRSKAKINTYKSLKWHLLVLRYLNPKMNEEKFKALAYVMAHRKNGFSTFTIATDVLDKILRDVYLADLEEPPVNRLRKIIFDPMCGLKAEEKLKIVGKLIGRQSIVNNEVIYQCMLDINDIGKKITIAKLAKILKCSSRTIHRNMSAELKEEKNLLNIDNEKI
jgi:hypothetical protein